LAVDGVGNVFFTGSISGDATFGTIPLAWSGGSDAFFARLTPASTNVPPTITAQPQSLTVAVGEPAAFNVGATGPVPIGYQWQFNSGDIPGATSSNYSIASATSNDAGGYSVIVSNPFGSTNSAVATLTVAPAAPPSFLTQPQSQTVAVGSNVV